MVQELNTGRSAKWIVGLTGGFGTGKSTVAHMLEELGACVIHADELAHEALLKGGPVYDSVLRLFKEAQTPDGAGLDRKKIAAVVFQDAEKRKKLEAIVHPYVRQRIWEEIADAPEQVVVVEVPLLFETGFNQFCDQTIAVVASDAVSDKRLMEKGFFAQEIQARREAQLALEEKKKRAGMIIDNSGTLDQTRREVEKIWKQIRPVLKGVK